MHRRFVNRLEGVTTAEKMFLPFGLCAKLCRSNDEAAANEFICRRTTIPIPQVLDVVPNTVLADEQNPDLERRSIKISTRLPDMPLDVRYGPSRSLRFSDASEEQLERIQATLADG